MSLPLSIIMDCVLRQAQIVADGSEDEAAACKIWH